MSDIDRLTAALADRYRLERELGQGGMATVYLAEDLKHQRKVAVKVLRPELAAALGADRFLNEIQVTANLQHAHILPLFDSGEKDGFVYYVMPVIEGESLRDRLRREGPLPIKDAARILGQVADALSYAHSRGVLHRDIKPDNVMLSGRNVTVMDFGVARAVSAATDESALTTAGMTVGTPAYMAPEQAAADPNIDHRVDIYALGVLGYELLAGLTPFQGKAPHQMLTAHMTEQPVPVTERRENVPPVLADVVMRCLEKDVDQRWASGEEVVRRLDAFDTPDVTLAARAGERRPWKKLVPVIGAIAILALIAAVTIPRLQMRPAGESTAVSTNVVAIFPFAVHGSADLTYLGDAMVNFLGYSLDGAGDLRRVAPTGVKSLLDKEGVEELDLDTARRLARQLGAGLFVVGDVLQAGNRLRLEAGLYDQSPGTEPLDLATEDGVEDDVMLMADRVASRFLTAGAIPASRVTQAAAVSTDSLRAYKAYLEGEAEFRAGRFVPAIDAFRRATDIDTRFALALFRLSVVADWNVEVALSDSAARAAVRHADRLSEHDSLLLTAHNAYREGRGDEAERRFVDIVRTWPQDVEAWFQLGETQFHYGPPRGKPLADARPAFERVIGFEPNHTLSLIHLQRIAASERDRRAMDTLGARILEVVPDGDRSIEAEVYRAMGLGDTELLEHVAEHIREVPDRDMPFPLGSPIIWSDGFAELDYLLDAALTPDRSPAFLAVGHAWRAHLLAGRGRWSEAFEAVRDVESNDAALGLIHRAYFVLGPKSAVDGGEVDRAELAELRNVLTRWDAGSERNNPIQSAIFGVHNGLFPLVRHYLLGLANVRLGREADALAARRAIEMLADGRGAKLAEVYAHSIDARLALAREDTVRTLAALERQPPTGNYQDRMYSPLLDRSLDRFLRAEILRALGRDDEAIPLYSSFEWYTQYNRGYAPLAHLALGRIAERAGRQEDARRHYERVLFLYTAVDSALAPLVDEAREALRRIG